MLQCSTLLKCYSDTVWLLKLCGNSQWSLNSQGSNTHKHKHLLSVAGQILLNAVSEQMALFLKWNIVLLPTCIRMSTVSHYVLFIYLPGTTTASVNTCLILIVTIWKGMQSGPNGDMGCASLEVFTRMFTLGSEMISRSYAITSATLWEGWTRWFITALADGGTTLSWESNKMFISDAGILFQQTRGS